MNICILGAGAWGTAMAVHLSRLEHTVTLVPRRLELAMEIATTRENKKYLPGFNLDSNLQIGSEVKPVIMEADTLFLACPSKYLRALCQDVRNHLGEARQLKLIITLSKGLEEKTNKTPIEIIKEILPEYKVGALCGPNYAGEVAAGKPTAIVFATSESNDVTKSLQQAISNENLRVYTSQDVIGVELGACLKNVYAIAVGISDGLQLGDNAKAALITRALSEMVLVGTSLGGREETFYGLSGVGDLVATCNGAWSRNRSFGERIAQGDSVKDLIEKHGLTVEGYRSTACFFQICKNKGLRAPIMEEVNAVLYHDKQPKIALVDLMTRELKAES